MNLQTDIVIIGAGPVGLSAVFQAGMLGLKVVIVDALEFPGGQCAALYPQKPIYDIPGFVEISGGRLIENLIAQADPFQPNYCMGQQVEQLIQHEDGCWEVVTSKGNSIKSKVVIISAGVGSFVHNAPPLDGIRSFEGTSVFYAVNDIEKLRNKNILIAGGGDSAVDWAVALAGVANNVYLVHRRDKFRAAPESVRKMEALESSGEIKILVPYQLYGLEGQGSALSKVKLQHLNGEVLDVEADIMLSFFGMAMKIGPITNWGLQLDKERVVVEAATMETNLPGVFAIGDIATYPGKLKFILTGFSEAALACHSAYSIINPGKPLHFEYSTTKGIVKP